MTWTRGSSFIPTQVQTLSLEDVDARVSVNVNVEDYKDISFPNIVIQILSSTLREVASEVYAVSPWRTLKLKYRGLRKDLTQAAERLESKLHEPDQTTTEITTREAATRGMAGKASATGRVGGLTANLESQRRYEEERSKSVPESKIGYLKTELTNFKKILDDTAVKLGISIFLVLDDYYFMAKAIQPDCIDYFHRLTKGTDFYLKIATIRYRSKLYRQDNGTPIGVERGHDIYEVDMDYTLDRFEDLQSFMKQLLRNACDDCEVVIDIDDFFAGEGFRQLCLASGGVPRDFLSLFVKLGRKMIAGEIPAIGKVEVNEAAIANYGNKFTAFRQDSVEEREVLEEYLRLIKGLVYEKKRTNTFLVAKDDLDEYPLEAQAIRELVDLRFLHLVDNNTSSAPSDGRRYEAYMLDVSLYANSRPRGFSQLEPGTTDDKSRRDKIRAAPRLELEGLHEGYLDLGIQTELQLSEEA